MKWQILSNGCLRGEISVTEGTWQLRLPEEGVTIGHTKGGGLVVECARSLKQIEVRMRPQAGPAAQPPCSCGHEVPEHDADAILV